MKFTRLTHALRKIFVDWSKPLAGIILCLSLLGFYLGKNLELKLSLTDLLPDHHPSVVKFEKITEMVGGVGYLIAVLEAKDGHSHIEFAKRIIPKLEANSMIRSAYINREEYFFASRMLYYLELEKLKTLHKSIEDHIRASRRKAFDIGLWDDEEKKAQEEINPDVISAAKKAAGITPILTTKDNQKLLLMMKPTFDSMDLELSKSLLKFVKETIDAELPKEISYDFAGRYYNKIEDTRIIEGDIFILGTAAIFLIFLVLYAYLRNLKTVIIILAPVLTGLGITIGVTELWAGHINIITGFLMGIVCGLGVDYSVHLALRLRLELEEGSKDAVWAALLNGGHGVFIGATAAAAAFFVMCESDFKAFREFGFICGMGILAASGSLLFSFAALANWTGLDKSFPLNPITKNWRPLPQLRKRTHLLLGILLTVALCLLSLAVHFEYNFTELMQNSEKTKELTQLVNVIYDRSVTPSVFAIEDKESAIAVEKAIKADYMPHTIETVVSGASIIPDHQPEKQVVLHQIRDLIKPFKDSWLEKELEISGSTIRRWVNAEPFTFSDLPIHLQDSLRGKKQSGYLMYVYAPLGLDTGTYSGVKTFAAFVKDLESRFPKLLTGSDVVVFAEILELIQQDGKYILIWIFLLVGIFIWLNIRRWDDSLATYIPLLIALPVGVGAMAFFGIKFNIFNIAIIPSFVAIGIDVPIHLTHRARQVRSGFRAAVDLAPAVQLSLLTTAIGFGILIFSRAGVLRSLGWLAVLGTLAIWWTGLFLTPAYLEWYHKRKHTNPH